jgi:uncharacterized LabA/DUF88 family protein
VSRVISYIDGFNLYFGLKAKRLERFLWLDVQALSVNLCTSDQKLVATKYFTSRVSGPPEKVKRQNTYLEALQTLPNLALFFGRYQMNPFTCRNCCYTQQIPSEKMTDVNIAVELMTDAFQDRFDTAILISADSDLVGPIVALHRLFPAKRVIAAFPPERFSANLRKVASAHLRIGRAVIAHSQLPETVSSASGFVLQRPTTWR